MYSSPRSGMELVGSSWWPLPSLEALALGGGGGGGGLILDVELTTTVAGGGCWVGPPFLWFPRIWVCGDIRTVSPRWPWGGLGHQPWRTLIALLTSAWSSAALSLAVWATFNIFHPRPRVTGLHLKIFRKQPLRSASFTKHAGTWMTIKIKLVDELAKSRLGILGHTVYRKRNKRKNACTRIIIQSLTDSPRLWLRFTVSPRGCLSNVTVNVLRRRDTCSGSPRGDTPN